MEKFVSDLMPQCAEKCLLGLDERIRSVQAKLGASDPAAAAAEIANLVNERLKELNESLARESLLNERTIKESWAKFEELAKRATATGSYADWAPLIELARGLIKLLRPLDLEEIFRLIDETKKGADIIRDQEIILLLGKTGAGKSTTAHFLAGTRLSQGVNNQFNVDEKALAGMDESLRRITISASANSETRFLSPVLLDLRTLISKSKTVYACDTPGFDDTAGVEVDIANAFGLVEAVQKSRSVRPVAVLNYDGVGGRLEGIIMLVELLHRVFVDLETSKSALTYVYTKCPKNFNVVEMLQHAYEREGLSDHVKSVIRDMIDKSKRDANIIDPLDFNAAKGLLKHIVSLNAIEYPSGEFKNFLTENSINQLKLQFSAHERSILSALKRVDFDLVAFKLGQLRRLREYLAKITWLGDDYRSIVRQIGTVFDQLYQESLGIFAKQLENRNRITQADVEAYKRAMETFRKVKVVVKGHFDASEQKDYAVLLDFNLVSLGERICDQICAHTFEDDGHLYLLDNMRLLADHFGELVQPIASRLNDSLVAKFKETSADIARFENVHDLDFFLARFQAASRIASSLPASHADQAKMDACLSILPAKIRAEAQRLLDSELPDFVVQANRLLGTSESAASNSALVRLVGADKLAEPQAFFYSELEKRFRTQAERIQTAMKAGFDRDSLSSIRPAVDSLRQLRLVAGLAARTQDVYAASVASIAGFIERFNAQVADKFKRGAAETTGVGFEEMSLFFAAVAAEAEWLNELRPQLASSSLRQYEREVLRKVRDLADQLADLGLGVREHANLDRAVDIYARLLKMAPLGEGNDAIRDEIESVLKQFRRRIEAGLDQIGAQFDLGAAELGALEVKHNIYHGIHSYLEEIRLGQMAPVDQEQLEEMVRESLRPYGLDSVERLRAAMTRLGVDIEAARAAGLSHHFPRLDGEFLESAVHFLGKLKRPQTRELRPRVGVLEERIEAYTRAWLKQKEEQMSAGYELVEREKGVGEAPRHVQTAVRIFKELSALKSKHPLAYETLSRGHEKRDPLGAFKDFYVAKARELESAMQAAVKAGESARVQELIAVAGSLRPLDASVFEVGEQTFGAAYEAFSREMSAEIQTFLVDVRGWLAAYNFRSLQDGLLRANELALSPRQLAEIRSRISFAARDTVEALRKSQNSVVKELPKAAVEGYVVQSAAAQRALTVLAGLRVSSPELVAEEELAELRQACRATETKMKDKFSAFLQAVEGATGVFRLKEVADKLRHFEQVYELAGESVDAAGSLIVRADELRRRQTRLLEETMREYAAMPVADYETRPPKHVLNSLQSAAATSPACADAFNEISADVLRNLLAYLRDKRSPPSTAERVACVRGLDYFLPDEIKAAIGSELKRLETPPPPMKSTPNAPAEPELTVGQLDVAAYVNRDDADRLAEFYFRKRLSEPLKREIVARTSQRVGRLVDSVVEGLSSYTSLRDLMHPVRMVVRYRVHFRELPEFTAHFKRLSETLLKKYNEALEDLRSMPYEEHHLWRSNMASAYQRFAEFADVIQILSPTS